MCLHPTLFFHFLSTSYTMTYALHIANADLKDKSPLARNNFIKLIGVSLVGLFLPAILWYEYHLSLSQIFLLEALFGLLMMLHLSFWTLKFTARYGAVPAMFLGISMFVAYFVILSIAKEISWVIWLLPLIWSTYTALFWTWYHSTMVQWVSHDKHFGIHQATIESAWIMAWLLGPLLGGLVADAWGTSYLYLIASICLCISCIPFLFHQRKHTSVTYTPPSLKRCLHMIKTPSTRGIFITFSTLGYIDFVANIVWPIILFALLNTYTKVALVSFVSTIVVLFIMRAIGKRSDAKRSQQHLLEKRIHYSFRGQGSVRLLAGISLISGFFSQFAFVVIDTIHKITHKANHSYTMTQWYKITWAQENLAGALDMIYFRELAIHSIKCVACILLALLSYTFPDTLWWLILPLFWVSLLIFFSFHFLTLTQTRKHEI